MTRYAPQWLQQGTYPASVDRRLPGALWPSPMVTGCAVSVGTAMTVNVAAGQVAVPTANNTGTVLCSSDAVEPVTLTTAPGAGSNRYDVIICQARGNDLDGGANNDFLFTMVTGTAAASPTVPAVPNNAVALANVYVPGGSASVTAGNIADVRPLGLALSTRARGVLGNVAPTSDQLLTTSMVAIGGAAITATPGAGRRVRVRTLCQFATAAGAAAGQVNLQIDIDGAVVGEWTQPTYPAHPAILVATNEYIAVATAGSHTYRTSASASQNAMWFQYCVMSVEDVGV